MPLRLFAHCQPRSREGRQWRRLSPPDGVSEDLGPKGPAGDFGTDQSSLARLHLLPIDTVAIDRSFVSQIDTSHHHRVLIEAAVNVANRVGMGTVAGIEAEAKAALVRELGCDKGQGYFISKPLAAPDVVSWVDMAHAPT